MDTPFWLTIELVVLTDLVKKGAQLIGTVEMGCLVAIGSTQCLFSTEPTRFTGSRRVGLGSPVDKLYYLS